MKRTLTRATAATPELDDILQTLPAEELREFVRDLIGRLAGEPQSVLMEALLQRATRSGSGWTPPAPPPGIVDDVRRFVRSATQAGYAEPEVVDAYFRLGTQAFLAGDHAAARSVFELLVPPIMSVDIDLGQHELVDEVLTVSLADCGAQYVVCVYMMTPPENRAAAVAEAIGALEGFAYLHLPLREMEQVAVGPLPGYQDFLPRWLRYLEALPATKGDWEGEHERWLREAVMKVEGVSGLERIALSTGQPPALREWCDTLAENGNWSGALRACDEAAQLVGDTHWRGDFLDGAALAAQQLGRKDAAERLQAAWLGAPSLVRLLRWLGAGKPRKAAVASRARRAIGQCPAGAGEQLGLLHLLTGEATAAAAILGRTPGRGWSKAHHPGHLLFPAFAGLLAEEVEAKLALQFFNALGQEMWEPMASYWEDEATPKLDTPSVLDLITLACPAERLDAAGRSAMLQAMRTAATKRVKEMLEGKHRRHYGHAAVLVACCLELSPAVGERDAVAAWVQDIRKTYSRFPAFQAQLKSALGSINIPT